MTLNFANSIFVIINQKTQSMKTTKKLKVQSAHNRAQQLDKRRGTRQLRFERASDHLEPHLGAAFGRGQQIVSRSQMMRRRVQFWRHKTILAKHTRKTSCKGQSCSTTSDQVFCESEHTSSKTESILLPILVKVADKGNTQTHIVRLDKHWTLTQCLVHVNDQMKSNSSTMSEQYSPPLCYFEINGKTVVVPVNDHAATARLSDIVPGGLRPYSEITLRSRSGCLLGGMQDAT